MKYSEALNAFQQITKRTENSTFVIVFCGVFSSGKTSIINYLLNNEFKLPVGINPMTKVVTRVRYGDELGVYYSCHELQKTVNLHDAISVLKGDILLPDDCSEIVVTMPSDFLKNGVEILDTPGFEDEMSGELEHVSRDAVLQSDMAVLCTNALKFGDMFEKEYIVELSESVHNFCLVVNRTNSLNTQKDYFDVVARAEKLFEGKISSTLKGFSDNAIFFTSADGNYPTLNGLDDYLAGIVANSQFKKLISSSSNKSIVAYQMKKLLEEINYEIFFQEQNIKELNEKNQELIQKKQEDLMLEKIKFCNKINQKKNSIAVQISSAGEGIERSLTELEKSKEYTEFVDESKKHILNYICFIAKDFDSFSESVGCRLNPNMQYSFKCFINEFSIPAPKGKRVKRSLTDRVILGAFSLACFDFPSANDIYYTEYKDYHIPAIKVVNDELIPGITELINLGFDQIEKSIDYECPNVGGFEGIISDCMRVLNEWLLLKDAAKNYIKQ